MNNLILVNVLQFIISIVIIFVIVVLAVEILLKMFNIQHPRVRAVLRFLPILKLPIDLILYQMHKSNMLFNLNPFSCENHLFKFLIKFFPANIAEYYKDCKTSTISSALATNIPAIWLKGLLISFAIVSFIVICRKVFQFIIVKNYLNKVYASSKVINRTIYNKKLQDRLSSLQVVILTSPEVHTPFTAGSGRIFFPEGLSKQLSQEEYEAVVAHELEHLRWYDPLLRQAAAFICCFFWWIPTSWWVNRMQEEQERACDLGVLEYEINNHALAAAVLKTINEAKNLKYRPKYFCYILDRKKINIKRLESILNCSGKKLISRILLGFIFSLLLIFITLFSFWFC